MEPLFECRFAHDEEWAKDLYGYICFRRPILRVLHIVLFLYFVRGVYMLIARQYADVVYLVVIPTFFIVMTIVYRANRNLILKREIEMYGKPVDVTLTVTNEEIDAVQSNGAVYRLQYFDIKKAWQTKTFVYLQSKAKVIFSFKKDGFTRGNAEEFLAFLKRKGIRVK